MADVKWIKVAVDIFENEKIQLITKSPGGDTVIAVWFMLLTLAGKQNNGGVFMLGKKPYTLSMFSKVLGRPASVIERAINRLCEVGLMENTDGVVSIPSWSVHQNVEKLKVMKEKRLAKNQKKEIDKDIDKETDKELFKSGFSPPTLEEVVGYSSDKGLKINPIKFFTYYSACGWKIGNKCMNNWRSAMDLWEAEEAEKGALFDINSVDKEIFNN